MGFSVWRDNCKRSYFDINDTPLPVLKLISGLCKFIYLHVNYTPLYIFMLTKHHYRSFLMSQELSCSDRRNIKLNVDRWIDI